MLGASGPSGHDAGADNIAVEKIKLELVSTGVIPGAAGEVELELRSDSDHGDAKIEARARAEILAPTAVYTRYVDRKFTAERDLKEGFHVVVWESYDWWASVGTARTF